MIRIANISLGARREEPARRVSLAGRDFEVVRHGTGRDFEAVRRLLAELDGEADVIAVSGLVPPIALGRERATHPEVDRLLVIPRSTPVVAGHDLRAIYQRWCLRDLMRREPELIAGRRVSFYAGILELDLLPVLQGRARSFLFGDPFLHLRAPTVLASVARLERYARRVAPLLMRRSLAALAGTGGVGYRLLRGRWAAQLARSDVIVAPWSLAQTFGGEELAGKVVITDRAADHALSFFRRHGAAQVLATYPSVAVPHQLDWSVMEAILYAVEGGPVWQAKGAEEHVLRWIERLAPIPQVQRFGAPAARRRKFAFVVQPRDQDDLFRHPWLRQARRLPPLGREALEWALAHVRPAPYGAVRGVRGAGGVEAEGVVIVVPATPRQAGRRSPRHLRRALLEAVERAAELGAEVVALGPTVQPSSEDLLALARAAPIPITTGHAYQASVAFWAAREATLRLGLARPLGAAKTLGARCVVVGASGSLGSVAARLCALAFDELVLAGPRPDRLLELKAAIEAERPRCKVSCTTRAGDEVPRADLIILAAGAHRGRPLEVGKVKPGCVVCDAARPSAIAPDEALRRPDVLVIDGGVVELPGPVELDCDIGLPGKSVYATLAEAALLALEGHAEAFSAGQVSLDKIKEIYRASRRHGVRLAGIRGPGGVLTDEDFALCREAALRRMGGRAP